MVKSEEKELSNESEKSMETKEKSSIQENKDSKHPSGVSEKVKAPQKEEKAEEKETIKAEEENKYKKRFAGKGGRNRRNTRQSGRPAPVFDKEKWAPRTALGKKVKLDEIKNIDEILDKGLKFIEPEIMDCFFPGSEAELLLVGQSKGKFGGGQKRVFKQTQKKTREGNKPKFATIATIGNKDGYVGIGYGKSKETVPAREKAIREAKLSLIKIRRGCGSWECSCKTAHSIPFKVKGKCGSVILTLMPAPKGTGLCVSDECKKLLSLAGVEDVWSSVKGKTTTKTNMINACFSALKQLMNIKIKPKDIENLGIIEGNANK